MTQSNAFVQRKTSGAIWYAGHSVWGLCAAINHATRPYVPLTEECHARSRLYTRACKNRMTRLGFVHGIHYKECESGLLWPLKRSNYA